MICLRARRDDDYTGLKKVNRVVTVLGAKKENGFYSKIISYNMVVRQLVVDSSTVLEQHCLSFENSRILEVFKLKLRKIEESNWELSDFETTEFLTLKF